VLRVDELRKYVAYARARCRPRLTEAASKDLQKEYVRLRADYNKRKSDSATGSPIPITVRQLEAIVRLSESVAKLYLSEVVTTDHVTEAIHLFKMSTAKAATGGAATGAEVYIGTQEFYERVLRYEKAIKRRLTIGAGEQRHNLLDYLTGDKSDADKRAAQRAITIMVQRNELLEQNAGKRLQRLALRWPRGYRVC